MRINQTVRILLIVLMLFGWFALSQRCALGQVFRGSERAALHQECCGMMSQLPEQTPANGSPSADCCRELSVLLPHVPQLSGAALADRVPLPFTWLLGWRSLDEVRDWLLLEPGPPPDHRGFVEMVLHRSLRSHAPPILA